ncbi:MAG: RNA methyltransferase [Bacteroidetes bacterium]|nr:MAG: RNA methyltransferase [Bacteroidota bacterium]
MLSASQLKFLTALQVKKYRQKYLKFTVEGSKMVAELLQQDRVPVDAIYGVERWAAENTDLLKPHYQKFNLITEKELSRISAQTTPNAVMAVAGMPVIAPDFKPEGTVFYLDGIRDPGNLGTIIRIADWFGMPAVYCSADCVDHFSPKVVQSSMGSVLRVPLLERSLEEAAQAYTAVFGAVMDGTSIYESVIPEAAMLVIGNESSGIRSEAERFLTHRITIPRSADSQAESLNASVAAGILAAFSKQSSR